MDYALGKQPAIIHADTLRLSNYLQPELLAAPPASVDLTSGIVTWPMYGNDLLPDCTAAAAAHLSEIWSLLAGVEYIPEEPEVEALWLASNGNDPTQGAYMLNLLREWQHKPLKGGVAPYAYVYVNWQLSQMVKTAIALFGGLYVGLAMPRSAMYQTGPDGIWSIVVGTDADWGSWGGHAVNIVGYDERGLTCITWGQKQKMSWAFFNRYCDEAWAVLPTDWQAVGSIDFERLKADLQAVRA